MTEKDHEKFRIQFDDENKDVIFEEEPEDIRIKRLNKRITVISILIFCFLALLIFAVYFDINKRFGSLNSAGKAVSNDLGAKLSSVSEKQAKFEDMLVKKIESVEKTMLFLDTEIKAATTAIKYIRSARKSDNKSLKEAMADIENTLKPVGKDLENAVSRIKAIDKNLLDSGKELVNIKDDLNKTKAGISKLSSLIIDRKTLDKTVNDKQEIYEKKLKQMASGLEEKIGLLQKKINKIEKNIPPVVQVSKPLPKKKPVEETLKPQPGTIIEQDIK